MIPPHLPPPTCDVQRHHQWQRLKLIGAAVFFGLCAGMSGAAIMVGWVWQELGGGDVLLNVRATGITREQASDQARAKVADKILTIYKRSAVLAGARYFNNADKLADAVIGVASGWAAAYLPDWDGRFKDWAALSADGKIYKIEKVLGDKRTGMIFVKISVLNSANGQEQIKAAGFSGAAVEFENVFVYQDGNWYGTMVTAWANWGNSSGYLEAAPTIGYLLGSDFRPGSIVIKNQGEVLGFVASNGNTVAPATALPKIFEGIDGKSKITYRSLGVIGWYAPDRIVVFNQEKVEGFLVERALNNKALLRGGDIILQVNGRPMTKENLWYNIGADKLRLKIWRAGKEWDLEAPVIEV